MRREVHQCSSSQREIPLFCGCGHMQSVWQGDHESSSPVPDPCRPGGEIPGEPPLSPAGGRAGQGEQDGLPKVMPPGPGSNIIMSVGF